MNKISFKNFELSSASLHIMAMLFMLLDHMWATVLSYNWMTCVGRIAFPIFAFLIVEGYKHTSNLKKYMLRLLVFAIISEVPFNLLYGNRPFYPVHQNVLWTLLISLYGIKIMDNTIKKNKLWLSLITCFGVCVLGFILGYALFVDIYGCGVLTVFVFYFFDRDKENNIISKYFKNLKHQKLLWTLLCFIGQFICLYQINVEILGGFYYNINIFGMNFELVQQGIALLALIPIWLYKGKQGYHAKWFKYFNYAFYPAHCLILGLIAIYG